MCVVIMGEHRVVNTLRVVRIVYRLRPQAGLFLGTAIYMLNALCIKTIMDSEASGGLCLNFPAPKASSVLPFGLGLRLLVGPFM